MENGKHKQLQQTCVTGAAYSVKLNYLVYL